MQKLCCSAAIVMLLVAGCSGARHTADPPSVTTSAAASTTSSSAPTPAPAPGKPVSNWGCHGVDPAPPDPLPASVHPTPKAKSGGAGLPQAVFGDPEGASRYWQQQSQSDCGLMATRLAIAELTGQTPTEAQMIDLAKKTPSECSPGEPVYDDSFDPSDGGTGHGTCTTDLALLLKHFGIESKYTSDTAGTGVPTGMKALQGYLEQGKQAIVCVNSSTIWDGAPKGDSCGHLVTVAAIDTDDDVVYLGDSGGEDTRGETVSIDTFESAWAAGGHEILLAG